VSYWVFLVLFPDLFVPIRAVCSKFLPRWTLSVPDAGVLIWPSTARSDGGAFGPTATAGGWTPWASTGGWSSRNGRLTFEADCFSSPPRPVSLAPGKPQQRVNRWRAPSPSNNEALAPDPGTVSSNHNNKTPSHAVHPDLSSTAVIPKKPHYFLVCQDGGYVFCPLQLLRCAALRRRRQLGAPLGRR
jgi:hypothetical protein